MNEMTEPAAPAPKAPPDPGGGRDQRVTPNQFPNLPTAANLYEPSNQLNSVKTNHFTRYLQIDFEAIDRKSVNPYIIQNEIKAKTGYGPAELTGGGKSRYTLKTVNAEQSEKCQKITMLANQKCSIKPHPKFNSSQGLIFTRDYNYRAEDIQTELKDQYGVSEVKEATFIKGRSGTTAFIVTFDREETPYSISIPGERSDCTVSPFLSRPMMCKKCLAYGHTQKRCKKEEPRCKSCSEEGHEMKNCQSQTVKCFHCKEDHQAGSKNCSTQMKEQQILKTVENEKVTFQRARQINEAKPIIRTVTAKTPMFVNKLDITWPKGTKRNTNPWQTARCIEKQLGGKTPRSIRTKKFDDDTITVEVSSPAEAAKLNALTRVGEFEVEVKASDAQNLPRGIIFIEGYDMGEAEEYENELKKQHKLINVEQAHWIKSRNPALLLTFSRELPDYLDIPGEAKRTVVLEYKRQPNLCRKCLNYGHSKKHCRDQERCENCTSTDHPSSQCHRNQKCLHCPTNGNHKTGSKNCQRYKMEEEIVAIQERSSIARAQAIIVYNQDHPESSGMNYAAAAATSSSTAENNKQSTNAPRITTVNAEVHSSQSQTSKGKPREKRKSETTNTSANRPRSETQPTPRNRNQFSALENLGDYDSQPEDDIPTLTPETQQETIASFTCESPSGRRWKNDKPQMLAEDEKTSRNCPEINDEVRKIFNDWSTQQTPQHTDTDKEKRGRRLKNEAGRADKRDRASSDNLSKEEQRKRYRSEVRKSGNDYTEKSEYNSRSRSPIRSCSKSADRSRSQSNNNNNRQKEDKLKEKERKGDKEKSKK